MRFARVVPRGSDLGNRLAGKYVGTFVEIVTGMTTHPMPVYGMTIDGSIESLPKIYILDRLLVGRSPAVALPAVDPTSDSLA